MGKVRVEIGGDPCGSIHHGSRTGSATGFIDAESGIAKYEFCVGSSASACGDLVALTQVVQGTSGPVNTTRIKAALPSLMKKLSLLKARYTDDTDRPIAKTKEHLLRHYQAGHPERGARL